jgi:hypothetical protein
MTEPALKLARPAEPSAGPGATANGQAESGPATNLPAGKLSAGVARPEALTPLLVDAETAAKLCGTSRPTWDRWTALGLNPAARRIGKRPLWSTEELRLWVELGCPNRKEFEARQTARRR